MQCRRRGRPEPCNAPEVSILDVAGPAASPGDGREPDDWRPKDRFEMVVETLGLAESELAEYCRRKGVFVEQILTRRSACMQAT